MCSDPYVLHVTFSLLVTIAQLDRKLQQSCRLKSQALWRPRLRKSLELSWNTLGSVKAEHVWASAKEKENIGECDKTQGQMKRGRKRKTSMKKSICSSRMETGHG